MRGFMISLVCATALFGENLRDVYEMSIKNDPTFLSAKESLKAGEEVEYQGYSVLMPKIILNSQSGYYDFDIKYKTNNSLTVSMPQNPQYNSSSYSANLIWPILRKDSIDLYRGSKVLYRIAKDGYEIAKQNIILKSASAYFDYLLTSENLELLRAQKKSAANELESALLNFRVGNATAIETGEAEARYDLMVSKELLAIQELEVKKDSLEKMTGAKIDKISQLCDNLDEKLFEVGTFDELKSKLELNPTIKKAKEQASFAALEYERSKANFFPALDVVAQRGKASSNGSVQGIASEQTSSYIGLALEFNIFNGGYDLSKTREYLANKNKASYDFSALKQQNENDALKSYLAISVGMAQMKAAKKAMESSKMSLDAFRTGQKIGLRTTTDLLNAEQAYFEAQKNYSSSKYSLILSYLKLRALTNELNDGDILRLNGLVK